MSRNQIRFVVILGSFAIIGIIIIQIYWMQRAWNSAEKQFNQSIFIALKNVAENLSAFNQTVLPNEHPVNQLSSNYFVVNTNSVIDVNVLDYYLRSEFDKLNIETDYEYAIYDCHDDKMVYGNYVSMTGDDKSIELTTNLPKYSDYIYYFGVNFPSKTGSVMADMRIWFVFSVILLVSVIFFAYAIFIILRQKRLSELQKDFINNMTHEFKTPISSINISADVIMHPEIAKTPDRLRNYGEIIKKENRRLNNQVEKVLQIARIEKSGFELKKEHIDINEIIMDVVDNCKSNNGTNVMVHTHLVETPPKVFADRLHFTNIIHNLLDNAIKYADKNPEIIISTQFNNQQLKIMIQDNGPGIGREFQKKVFHKFYRIPTGNVHNVKGFGLGLYYVKNICHSHRWNIQLISEVNKGATFVIEIPAA
jgi:two-component system, OmpR family, phosphate regulon sensor histidine kinase PhoR